MKSAMAQVITISIIAICALLLGSVPAYAQKDTTEFKFIPKYYPEDDTEYVPMPPAEIVHSPTIAFPDDPKLQGKQADVWMKVLVNRKGIVMDAQVLKSSDAAFNKYAIKYARQYTYKWSRKWPATLRETKGVWMSIPVRFRP